MKQTTIRMHMNPEESLGTVGHVIDKDLRNKEAHINPNGDFEVWVNKGVYGVYKEVFGEVIEEYNRKQKRKDRRNMAVYALFTFIGLDLNGDWG